MAYIALATRGLRGSSINARRLSAAEGTFFACKILALDMYHTNEAPDAE